VADAAAARRRAAGERAAAALRGAEEREAAAAAAVAAADARAADAEAAMQQLRCVAACTSSKYAVSTLYAYWLVVVPCRWGQVEALLGRRARWLALSLLQVSPLLPYCVCIQHVRVRALLHWLGVVDAP